MRKENDVKYYYHVERLGGSLTNVTSCKILHGWTTATLELKTRNRFFDIIYHVTFLTDFPINYH